jgi:hypothetical protein
MKLPNTEIERAAAVKDIRRCLNHVHLDVENECVVACAGSSLAVVPVEVDEGDTTGPITKDAIKAARKTPKQGEATILANGSLRIPLAGVTLDRPTDDGAFPDYQRVMVKDNDRPTIALDAELLVELSRALNRRDAKNGGVRLHLPRYSHDNIKVEPMWGPAGAVGVLCPMRDDGPGQNRYNAMAETETRLARATEHLARCLNVLADVRFALPEHGGVRNMFREVEEFLMEK